MGADWVKSVDFKDADGGIDWKAFQKARLENGEVCESCRDSIVYPRGHRASCLDCEDLSLADEVSHGSRIRCPKCGAVWDPHEAENYDVFEDGEHEVSCQECDCDFTVSTDVSYTFTSPAKLDAIEARMGGEEK